MDSQDFISAPKPNSKKRWADARLMHSRGTMDEQSGDIKASFFFIDVHSCKTICTLPTM